MFIDDRTSLFFFFFRDADADPRMNEVQLALYLRLFFLLLLIMREWWCCLEVKRKNILIILILIGALNNTS